MLGKNVATLTREKLALEPQEVLEAVGRMDDLPEYAERAAAVRGAFAGPKMRAAAVHGASAEAWAAGDALPRAFLVHGGSLHRERERSPDPLPRPTR